MPDRYAVIGNPISHSKSPLIHAEFARVTQQDLTYETLLAPLDGFAETVAEFARRDGKGVNVTVPFKEEAFHLASRVSARASAAKAVNTLMREDKGWFGDNTDGAGLVRDLAVNLKVSLKGARILLLGAGGAARGVLLPLLLEAPHSLTIANRTPAKARRLQEELREASEFRALAATLSVSGYDELHGAFDVVINATSASLKGDIPSVPQQTFADAELAYDMMYGAGVTPFLEFARTRGARRISEGIGMLVEQAAESFHLWRGVRPPTLELIARLKSF
jgi:shikimate dehydrogenase